MIVVDGYKSLACRLTLQLQMMAEPENLVEMIRHKLLFCSGGFPIYVCMVTHPLLVPIILTGHLAPDLSGYLPIIPV